MEKIKVIMIDDNVNLISMVEDYFEDNQKIAGISSVIAAGDKIIIDGEEYFGDTVWGDDAIKVRDKRNSVIDIYYQ